MIRKYAFHIILAGYRFSKSGQKIHSSRSYIQGFQVYKGHSWTLSEDHILYSLGHKFLLIKDHRTAANLFNNLLSMPAPNPNPLQQMCHLLEFFIVHHLREKKDKVAPEIPIPTFHPQELIVDLGGAEEEEADSNWQSVEKVIVEAVTGQEVMFMSSTSQYLFGQGTANRLRPRATVGELIRLTFPSPTGYTPRCS